MSEDAVTDLTRGVYRRLYSGFITGQRINKLSLQAEAWFWRVLATVDDFGNGHADPDLCRAATVGKRKIPTRQISEWLRQMKTVGLIEFYTAKGEPYLHIVGFEVSQPANRNGKRIRRFPVPDESGCIQVNPGLPNTSGNESDTENEDDTETEARSRGKPRSPTQVDDEFINELQAREPYQKLNVKQVFGKMVAWCEVKHKQPTRLRLINWLNREDQPMESSNGTYKQSVSNRSDSKTDFVWQPKSKVC